MEPKEIGWECVDLIHLAQDSEKCRSLVNAVMNLRFHGRLGVAEQLSASHEELSSIRLVGWLEDIRPPAGVTSQHCAIVYRNLALFGLSRKQSLEIECRHKSLFRELSEDCLFATALV
jgi:hypothetical protein